MHESRNRARWRFVLLGFGFAAAFFLVPVEEFAPSVAVHVGGDAWACGGYMSLPDPMCMDPDTDGDGIPDSQDPCPNEPNPNCELVIVYGDPTDLQVECTDGTRVADATECPNYYDAMSGNNGNGQTDDDDASRGGRGAGGGGGGGGRRGRENGGVEVTFGKPDDKTRRYEPTARNIDSCVHQRTCGLPRRQLCARFQENLPQT